jgi:hypothetical protein
VVVTTLKRHLCALALLAVGGAVQADVPDGIELGPWILAPAFEMSYEADSNVFLDREEAKEDDRVTTFRGDLEASLPFSNSMLEFDYSAIKESYSENIFPRDVTHVGSVDLELNFRSGDRLTFGDAYRRDFARSSEIDAGGELTFDGQPYTINYWFAELARTDPRRQGYVVRIRRVDFNYDGEVDIGFFEYRGFENSFEYRQPLPRSRSWVVRYNTRRFNHYDPDEPVGIPFRKEKTDNLQFGLRGWLGEDQPFRIHLGFGRFSYDGENASDFNGIVGTAAWKLRLGPGTSLDLEAVRRTLPSNFETYYINNAVNAELEREWRRFEAGTELELTKNDYGDVLPQCNGKRRDLTMDLSVFAGWEMHERLEFSASTFFKKRSSTCENREYEAGGIEIGMSLGWF